MQTSSPRLRVAATAGFAWLIAIGSAAPATALGITPDPLVFDYVVVGTQHFKGNLDFVGMVTGTPAGGSVLAGSVGATDVTLIFTATIDADSDFGMGSTYITPFPSSASLAFTGVGTIPNGGVDVDFAEIFTANVTVYYDFVAADELHPGETSDPFFVSFSSLAGGDQLEAQYIIISMGVLTVVPEPQLGALLLLGAGALGWRVRRGHRSARV